MGTSRTGGSPETTAPDPTAPSIEALIERFAPVAHELERNVDELIDRITTTIRNEIPAYRPILYGALRDGIAVHVRRGLEAARGEGAPAPADLEEVAVLGREVAHFGVESDDLLQATRTGTRIFWLECVRVARERGIDSDTLVAAADVIWRWADAVELAAARGHREASGEAIYSERQRSSFVLGTLLGSIAGPELRSGAEVHGLVVDGEYLPLRARAFGADRHPYRCERTIRRAGGPTASDAMLCPLEGDLIGIVSRRPEIDDPEVAVGLGPPVPLERLSASYGEAARALEVGARFGLRGDFDLADLSLRAAVASETPLGKLLVERYLEPLRDGSHLGRELERTLRAYLQTGLRGESAARALDVHVNTVRNRLRRIEARIGGELRDHARLTELWWALEYDGIAGEVEQD